MLTGRRIVVTGGSSGIGRELTRRYAASGAMVWPVARSAEGLAETIAGLPAASAVPITADLTTEAGRRAVSVAIAHAETALDVVVHAAGALGPIGDAAALHRYPQDAWHEVLAINVTAVQFLHQRLFGFLEAGHRPAVIGVSSSVGRAGRGGWGMYSISKRALEGWLEVLADEWTGRVYSVNPGGTATPMRAAAVPDEDPASIPTPADITPLFLRLAHADAPEPSGAKLDARDWIGRDPWEGII